MQQHTRYQSASGWRLFAWSLALVLATVWAVACGGDVKVATTKAAEAKKDDAKPAEKKEEAKDDQAEKDYLYTSIGKRDPFRSPFDDLSLDAEVKEETILSPLQNYDVNSFAVTGVIWGTSSPSAMVAAPDGQTYIVKTGSLIGRNWGKVVKIKSDAVVVLEQSPLPDGTKVSNLTEIKMAIKPIQSLDLEAPQASDAKRPTGDDEGDDIKDLQDKRRHREENELRSTTLKAEKERYELLHEMREKEKTPKQQPSAED